MYVVVTASRSLNESEPGGVLRMRFLMGVTGPLITSLQNKDINSKKERI
jgi:hypothetical protein